MAIRILFVDDEKDTLRYVQFMLQRRGYEVETAAGGREALEKAKQNPPDLFLVDVLMPDLNGYHVTEAVRKDPKLKHLPVILFSAATRNEYKTYGFEVGADDYLTKPILNDALDGRIKAAIQLAEKRLHQAETIPLPPLEPGSSEPRRWPPQAAMARATRPVSTTLRLEPARRRDR